MGTTTNALKTKLILKPQTRDGQLEFVACTHSLKQNKIINILHRIYIKPREPFFCGVIYYYKNFKNPRIRRI
jgi:hypothetical protein